MKRILVALALLAPTASFAVVDMKNANYVDSYLDLVAPGSGFDLRVQRTYNSRSIFIGMFGFGWCSDFETSIEKTPEGNLKLTECGGGQSTTYSPNATDSKDVDKTVNAILTHVKKTNKSATKEYLKELTEQLQQNSSLRGRWLNAAGMKPEEPKKGVTYSAAGKEVEKIVFEDKHYVRTTSDGNMQKFDTAGRMAFIYDRNGNFIRLNWKGDLLKEVVDNSGRKLDFDHYPNKKVKQIKGPDGLKAEYKYNSEDLVEVTNIWRNAYKFEYDDTHNLTKVTFPDKTTKVLTYNQKNDWVTSFKDQDNCLENYKYEEDKSNPKDHFWATATKTCGKNVVNQGRFEFWYKPGSDGRRYLSRVLTKTQADELDVTYHPELGRPLTVRRNNLTTTFTYYPNGLIRERATTAAKSLYEYQNQFNKVSKVATEFFDQKGKSRSKRTTTFKYDNKANLIFAENSDGQTVRMTYDARGRIASITDQAKKEVLIKYEERFGKPAMITRPKVGSINVTYKANGEINKVESKEGPTVAVQVAATFNNLLDIISPATSELNL